MAHIGIQAHFLGETCVWAEKAQVDDIKRSIDKRREDITSSLMETYSLDVSAQRFVDFVETSAVAEPGGGGMPFKGRPKFSKDCRVRSKRGKFLPAEEEGLCIGTLICILMEISPGKYCFHLRSTLVECKPNAQSPIDDPTKKTQERTS